MALMEELKAQGICTKSHVSADGSKRGGIPFVRGPLHHLLSNPIYIGKVQHRGLLHEGQHEPIVDQQLWDAVQAKRKHAIGDRRVRGNSQHASLLTGMIRDHADRPMSPSHAVKTSDAIAIMSPAWLLSLMGARLPNLPCAWQPRTSNRRLSSRSLL